MAVFKVRAVPDFTQLKSEINKLQSKPIKIKVETQPAKIGIGTVQREIDQLGTSAEKTGGSISNMFTKLAAVSPVYAAVRAFREALDTMKAVDTELVSIQKVTGYTAQQMDRLSESAYNLASQYGRTADEVLAAATTFARAGYGDQIEALAELSLLTQNVGDVSADTASKFIIAADAAWKLGGNEAKLRGILDGLNQITNKHAVDMAALTEAITVGGSVFAEAGESAQTFVALVGAGVASTQRSGSEIARALRTILMNIRQIRGETEDGELIDGESIANASKALKEYAGISTMANGQLRRASDVLDDLAEKWEKLDTVAQSAISEALAGKRQSNVLMALMGDWEEVEQAISDYANGVGSALEENEYYLDSWEAKSKQLSAAWTEFVSHLIETDTIKGALDGVIGLVELLDTDVGHAVVTAGAAAAALVGVATAIGAIKKSASAFSLASLNPWVLGIMAVGAAIGVVQEVTKNAQKSIADFDAEIESANEQLQSNKNRLDEINAIPWHERTSDIIKEKQALESENKELERQIELLEEEKLAKATKNTGDNFSIITDRHLEADPTIGSVEVTTEEKGADAYKWAIDELDRYNSLLEENIELNDTQIIKYNETILQIAEQVDYLKLLKDHGVMLTEQEQALINAYENHAKETELVADAGQTLISSYTALTEAGYLTEGQYQKLIALYPELANAATQAADGYVIQKDALENLMSAEQRQQAETLETVSRLLEEAEQAGETGQALYDLVAAQITASNTELNFSQQISALQTLAATIGYTTQAYGNLLNAGRIYQQALVLWKNGKYSSFEEARSALTSSAWEKLTSTAPGGGWSGNTSGYTGGGSPSSSGGNSSSSSDSARKNAQAAIKQLQKERDAELDVIQKQIDALQDQAEIEDRQAKIEEYKLEILKKQDAVMNARNERTVRQYNAATGQWEWVADAAKVKKAEEELEDAKKDLRDYESKVELDLAVDELKARQEAIKAAYQIKIDAWQDYLNGLSGSIASESQYLNQSVANNVAAADRVKKAWEEANAAKDNKPGVESPGGKDDTVYAPSTATETEIKTMQAYLGVAIDGIWGAKSSAALKNSRFSSFDAMLRHFFADGGALDQAVAAVSSGNSKATQQYKGMKTQGYSNQISYASVARVMGYDEGGILQGMGGIKATPQDEIVLPPKLAAKMLTPLASQTFRARVSELGYMYGSEATVPKSLAGNSITDSHNVTTQYIVNGAQIGTYEAEHMSMADVVRGLAGESHHLQGFGNRI